jgi:hypothetical protein
MLVIVGMILLLSWIFERAFHLTADSLVNLLLIFASISFALDFFRERDTMEPRPGWDNRPSRRGIGAVARSIRRRFDGPSSSLPRSAANRSRVARTALKVAPLRQRSSFR